MAKKLHLTAARHRAAYCESVLQDALTRRDDALRSAAWSQDQADGDHLEMVAAYWDTLASRYARELRAQEVRLGRPVWSRWWYATVTGGAQ